MSYNNPHKTLTHWGVLGMKWGVRRSRPSSSDHKELTALRKKKGKELTSAELQKAISRLQLERQYKDLTATKIDHGRRQVEGILMTAATTAVTTYIISNVSSQIPKLMKLAVDVASKG